MDKVSGRSDTGQALEWYETVQFLSDSVPTEFFTYTRLSARMGTIWSSCFELCTHRLILYFISLPLRIPSEIPTDNSDRGVRDLCSLLLQFCILATDKGLLPPSQLATIIKYFSSQQSAERFQVYVLLCTPSWWLPTVTMRCVLQYGDCLTPSLTHVLIVRTCERTYICTLISVNHVITKILWKEESSKPISVIVTSVEELEEITKNGGYVHVYDVQSQYPEIYEYL